MQEHGIGTNLFNIGVLYYVTISPRQEYLGRGGLCIPDSEHHSGTESCSQSFSPDDAIFTNEVLFGYRDSRFARDPPQNFGPDLLCL